MRLHRLYGAVFFVGICGGGTLGQQNTDISNVCDRCGFSVGALAKPPTQKDGTSIFRPEKQDKNTDIQKKRSKKIMSEYYDYNDPQTIYNYEVDAGRGEYYKTLVSGGDETLHCHACHTECDKTAGDICFKCYAEDAMSRLEILEPFLEEYEDEWLAYLKPIFEEEADDNG